MRGCRPVHPERVIRLPSGGGGDALNGPARMIVVPGLAVHAYVELPVQHLRDNGYDARLLQPPAWRGVEHDLEATAAIW
jgi:hypothetical protein